MDSDTFQSHCLNEDILALLDPELQASPFAGPSPPYNNAYCHDSSFFSQTSPAKSLAYGDEDEGFEDCEDTLQAATDPTLAESGTLTDLSLDNIAQEFFPFGEDDFLKTLQTSELVDQGVAMEPDLSACLVGVSSPATTGIPSPATTGIPSPAYSDHSPYHYSYGQSGSRDPHMTEYSTSPVPSTTGINYDTEMTNELYPLADGNTKVGQAYAGNGLQLSDIDTYSFFDGGNINTDIHQQLLNYSDIHIPLNFGLTSKTDTYAYQPPPTTTTNPTTIPINQTSSRGSQTERRSPTPSGPGLSPANSVATEFTYTDSEVDVPSPASPTLYCSRTKEDLVKMPYYDFKKILESPNVSERDKQSMKAIRKKGKNKEAARDCRTRKLEVIRKLEKDIKELKGQKTMLALKALKLQKDIEFSKKRAFTSKLATVVH